MDIILEILIILQANFIVCTTGSRSTSTGMPCCATTVAQNGQTSRECIPHFNKWQCEPARKHQKKDDNEEERKTKKKKEEESVYAGAG